MRNFVALPEKSGQAGTGQERRKTGQERRKTGQERRKQKVAKNHHAHEKSHHALTKPQKALISQAVRLEKNHRQHTACFTSPNSGPHTSINSETARQKRSPLVRYDEQAAATSIVNALPQPRIIPNVIVAHVAEESCGGSTVVHLTWQFYPDLEAETLLTRYQDPRGFWPRRQLPQQTAAKSQNHRRESWCVIP